MLRLVLEVFGFLSSLHTFGTCSATIRPTKYILFSGLLNSLESGVHVSVMEVPRGEDSGCKTRFNI